MNADALTMPKIAGDMTKFKPSEDWTMMLSDAKAQLIAYGLESRIARRKELFEEFLLILKKFRAQNLNESPQWNHHYTITINKWLTVANEELKNMEQQAKTAQPIQAQIYRPGDALNPSTGTDIFIGRDDVSENFKSTVLTSPSMPMFLIHGQRRVGKTSLIKFLPAYLSSRFKIVFMDMQDGTVGDIPTWFTEIRARVNKELSMPQDNWQAPTDWLDGWKELRAHLESVTAQRDHKLILTFDEYEIIHDKIKKDPDNAKQLLGALRSFSQHQNRVVFLFSGAKFFRELKNPNWGEYFVQSILLHVDYLKKEDTLKLITKPVENFKLIYPPELAARIYDLTQGHPALVQLICSEMVDIANRDGKKDMTNADLEEALEKTITRNTQAIEIFWSQFCNDPDRGGKDKNTVREILDGKTPSDKSSVERLSDHGFIVKSNIVKSNIVEGEGGREGKGGSEGVGESGSQGESIYRMRVPLFEQWLRKYSDTSY